MIYIIILFLLSGIIKSFLIYFNINIGIDLTLLLAVLIILGILNKIRINGFNKKLPIRNFQPILILIIFYIWIIITLFYTESQKYCYYKALYFLTNLFAFIPILLIKNFNIKDFVKKFQIISLILGLAFSVVYIIYFKGDSSQSSKQFVDFSGNTLSISEIFGVNVIILLTSQFNFYDKKSTKIILLLLFITVMIISSARGPILSLIIVCVLYYLYNLKLKNRIYITTIIKISFVFLFLITFVVFMNNSKTFKSINSRIALQFQPLLQLIEGNKTSDMSINVRINHYIFTSKKIFSDANKFIFGYGIGSYGYLINGIDDRDSPHNVLLEIIFELGLIGLLLFLIFISFFFINRSNCNSIITNYIVLYFLLNMLKSNSIVDLRIAFSFFALSLVVNYPQQNDYELTNKGLPYFKCS